jgi:hypothetical protein
LLTKPIVMDIAQKIVEENSSSTNSKDNQNMTNEMTFTLSPSKNATNTGSLMMDSNSMNMPMNNDGGSSSSGM